MIKDIRYIVGFLFIFICILGFFVKYTLFSSIKEHELRTYGTSDIYFNNKEEINNDQITLHITIGQKLKTQVFIPYIWNYISNSGVYEYSFDIFPEVDYVKNLKIYFKSNEKVLGETKIDDININKQVYQNGNIKYSLDNNQVLLNIEDLVNLQFVAEFDGKKEGKIGHYKVIRHIQSIEKKYFGNMFIYFLGRNN